MITYLEYLNVPLTVGIAIIGCFVVMQVIGEFLEFKGKVVPEFLKVRKFFANRKAEKKETADTLREVKQLLGEFNERYSEDNIEKRNAWMNWVNEKFDAYNNSIVNITSSLSDVTQALTQNNCLTEEMFVQSSRDRIIDFSYKAADYDLLVSREEFHRIFKVYDKYEKFLEEHNMTNGEIDIVYGVIKDSYEVRMKNHLFSEEVRGLKNIE